MSDEPKGLDVREYDPGEVARLRAEVAALRANETLLRQQRDNALSDLVTNVEIAAAEALATEQGKRLRELAALVEAAPHVPECPAVVTYLSREGRRVVINEDRCTCWKARARAALSAEAPPAPSADKEKVDG